MKKSFVIAAVTSLLAGAALVINAGTSRMKATIDKTDGDGHILTALWKEYADAVSADKPKRQASVLEAIIKEASEKRLSWDFYDACRSYESAVSSRNWKMRDSLRRQFEERVKEYDDPLVTFEHMRTRQGKSADELTAFAVSQKSRLVSARNAAFYGEKNAPPVSQALGGCLSEKISNDYEYALWTCLFSTGGDIRGTGAYAELSSILGGTYPCGAYLEYRGAASIPYKAGDEPNRRIEALREVAKKYDGKAVGIYPKQDILRFEFGSLQSKNASSDEYRALLAKAEDLEKERKSFSGSEARIVRELTYSKDLIETLNSRSISLTVEDGKAVAMVRNLPTAEFSIKAEGKDKAIWTRSVPNPVKSFYAMDTISVELPPLDDGSWSVEARSGKTSDRRIFNQRRLSLAARRDSRGYGIYVTDYKSGEPLKRADLRLSINGKEISFLKDVELADGFTPLPESLAGLISKDTDWKELTALSKDPEGRLLSSEGLSVGGRTDNSSGDLQDRRMANIYLDRGAYNPGDTVRFKAVLFSGDMVRSLSVAENVRVKATLIDSEGNSLISKDLTSNDFGSVAGEFTIPTGLRGGSFRINVEGEGWSGGTIFTVDEFILPSFSLSFDPGKDFWFPGDTVRVSGKVTSYSGHSLSGAVLTWKVLKGSAVAASGTMNPAPDGAFSLEFPAENDSSWAWYNVNVTVTDGTGETLEFNKGVPVVSRIGLGIYLKNAADGEARLNSGISPMKRRFYGSEVLGSDTAEIVFSVSGGNGGEVPASVSWSLEKWDGSAVKSAKASSGETVSVDMSSLPAGRYRVKAKAVISDSKGKEYSDEAELDIVKIAPEDTSLGGKISRVFMTGGTEIEAGGSVKVRMGTTEGPVWALAEIFGDGRKLLASKTIYLEGKEGESGSLTEISFGYEASWPDAVRLGIFYFKDSESVSFNHEFRRVRHSLDLPLTFSSFEDRTLPRSQHTFTIKTLPGVECLASVYDKSVDAIRGNWWNTVSLGVFRVPYVSVDAVCGGIGSDYPIIAFGRIARNGARMMTKGGMVMEDMAAPMAAMSEAAMEDDGISLDDTVDIEEAVELPADLEIREDFAPALAFEPFLRSGDDGNISLTFRTSDKLSTYVVALYAHTRDMRNAVLRREMTVTLPVKVSIAPPEYLYSGDRYSVALGVSGNDDAPVSGKLILCTYDGPSHEGVTPVDVKTADVTVPAGESVSRLFEVKVPETSDGEKIMGLKAAFVADGFSDGVFVTVPVRPAAQTLTESHSAVILPGADEEALLEKIRSSFVNVSPYGAEYKEISIIDMVREALPSKAEPASDNVLDLSETYYVRQVATGLGAAIGTVTPTEKIWEKILSCRNAEGGFSWFQGMDSSPVITAILLERFAKLKRAGLLPEIDLAPAVKYLDQNQFDMSRPFWCGGLGDEQYMLARSLYPEVEFSVKPRFMPDEFNKRLRDFRKEAKEYLVPGKVRGMNGRILAKARRVLTLRNLLTLSGGTALAKSWGVTFSAASKMTRSLEADIESILEYAVEHPDGGMYFPNAVMPFRGLLESEAYAHSLICDLLTAHGGAGSVRTADGIRIWLMLQKETQQWGSDPAYVDAISSILDGSPEVLATKVILMSKTYEKPFRDIRAAGNGFTIERRLLRHDISTGSDVLTEVRPGEIVRKGEKLTAEYRIWNQENRSFVVVEVPREAAFRPAGQLSGRYGFGLRPMRVNGWYSFTPGGYRDVKADRTRYFFDSYPEESTTIREEMFATQTGVYTAPVVTVESLYAPHYRANGPFAGEVTVE